MIYQVSNISYDCWLDGVDHRAELSLPESFEVSVGDDGVDVVTAILRQIEREWLVNTFDYRLKGADEWKSADCTVYDAASGIDASDPDRAVKMLRGTPDVGAGVAANASQNNVLAVLGVSGVGGWPTPDLDFMLNPQHAPVPEFPLDVLGPFWSSFIADSAGDKLPRDYFAMTVLGTAAGLIGNALEAAMPSPSTLTQPATLWLINIGHPGAGKTPAFEPFLKIVSDIEYDECVAIKIEDATIAGTINALLSYPHGVFVMNDELSGWWGSFKVDRQGEQFWLKAWNGNAPYTVSRGGRPPRQDKIQRHNLSVVGGSQPATLPTMLQATSGVERGFVSRCMFAFPDKPQQQQATGKLPNIIDAARIMRRIYALPLRDEYDPVVVPVCQAAADYHDEWYEQLKRDHWIDPTTPEGQWLAKQYGTALRIALVLETLWWAGASPPDAKVVERARKYAAMAEPKNNASENERLSAEKKLAELSNQHGLNADEMLSGGTGTPSSGPRSISLRAMTAACALVGDYFYPHFMRCQQFAYPPVHDKPAVDLTTMLIKKGLKSFNARELRQYGYGQVNAELHGNRAAAFTNEVCDFLETRHIIRRRAGTASTGRKPLDYDVNPAVSVLVKQALARR